MTEAMTLAPPIASFVELSDLGQAGEEVTLVANAGQRARLAEWAGLEAVDHFEAVVNLKRLSRSRFGYQASVKADITQSCVVTLEPVRSHLSFEFSRELHLAHAVPKGWAEEVAPAPADDEGPEEIESTHFDVAAPVLEEFALAIDPYPRAAGVVFKPQAEAEERESPFAALKGLKKQG
ncbi:MAG TPA: DUF177 domain-containing protein [Rhizomicrobium sp.]|nr:DUF177 domain-containing protein [Rhizomicrobium sp.]